ncbi:MAG: STAS domain-containing protein [Lachnospiraceae bacterium]|nr:STAS domain-containing protein [Lachnospiraceae bacterium]
MEILKSNENGAVKLQVKGEIDGSNVKEFELSLREASKSTDKMILDLDGLEYVSSAGLRVFLIMQKQMGDGLVIKNVTGEVKDIFSLTGFVKLLNIREDE